MKREVKLLHKKALDSLILSIEHFNRPDDRGRVSSVLILLDLRPPSPAPASEGHRSRNSFRVFCVFRGSTLRLRVSAVKNT
jgi:hypothetical protein